jgi:CDC45-like protein
MHSRIISHYIQCNMLHTIQHAACKCTLQIDVHRENKKWAGTNSRPLILLAERRATYLVVGVNCPERSGEVSSSRFGASFELAAQHMNARVRLDGFDRNVVEVPREHGTRFVELVYETMDA